MLKAQTFFVEVLATPENVPVSFWQKKSAICLGRTQFSDHVSTNFRIENKHELEINRPRIEAIQTMLDHVISLFFFYYLEPI